MRESDRAGFAFLLALSLSVFLVHFLANLFVGYGYFRDELYYMACSNRLSLGYVDQPPLSIWILALSRRLFGESLAALRLLPALASAATVFLGGLTARQLGGRRAAVFLSAAALSLAPVFLVFGSVYSMNSFCFLLWAGAVYLIIRILDRPHPRAWIFLGIVTGLGLLNKIDFLWFGAGLILALLLTPLRKHLATIWPYLAGLIALLIFSPYIAWNIGHDFAHLEFIRNALATKYSGLTRWDYVLTLFLILNPLSIVIWLSGLYYYFLSREGRKSMALGIIFLTAFAIPFIQGSSKSEYAAPAFPALFAAGAVVIEKITRASRRSWLLASAAVALVGSGLVLAPLARPLLPVEAYVRYADLLGLKPTSSEDKELSELPQFYADMFGWEDLARNVSRVFLSIPEAERTQTVVLAGNYGEAGALEFFGRAYPLPRVICAHNSYWIWGYGDAGFQTVIVLGRNPEDLQHDFAEVARAGTHTCRYCMPYEDHLPIFLCRGLKRPMSEVWPELKGFN